MKHSTVAILMLISLAIPQAGHFLANAAENAGQATTVAASPVAQQWIQQGRAWLAKNKYAEAIQCFEKAVAISADPAASYETRRLLADTYNAWLQSVQATRYQVSGQAASAQERLNQIQQEVDQAKQALADLAAQQKQALSSHGKIRVDAVSQANRNTYELKILVGTTAINNQTRLVASLKQQMAALEIQANDIQSRMPTPTILRITEAQYGLRDVTAAVQDLIHGDKATICASANAFGLSPDKFPDVALKISYELRGEKKEINVPQGWTVKLPSGHLISPPLSVPEPPWYEKHLDWLLGGVAALLLIVMTFWPSKPKDWKLKIEGDDSQEP